MSKKPHGNITVACQTCGKLILRYECQIHSRVFCSKQCRVKPVEVRFWEKVDKSGGENACWPFIACLNHDKYGHFPHRFPWGKEQRSNRIAWILTFGRVPVGKYVLHKCPGKHLRACCNPAHLYIGDQPMSMQDAIGQGTHYSSPGEKHPNSFLKEPNIHEIRRDYGKYGMGPILAKKFNVSIATIRDVAKRRSWQHIKDEPPTDVPHGT